MKLSPGSISSGTLKLDDLLENFANALALHAHGKNKKLIKDAMTVAKAIRHAHTNAEKARYFDDTAHELLDDLSIKLNELCPRGHYFGSHVSDGADFGVWQYIDRFEHDETESPLWSSEDAADESYQAGKEQE